jgi:hypothetical protein
VVAYGSILILLIAVFAISSILVKILRSNGMRNYFFGKRVRWIFAGYIAILVICAGLSPWLPTDGKSNNQTIDLNVLEHADTELYEAALAGNIDKVDSNYIKKTWNLNYQGQQLTLTTPMEEFINTSIMVKRKTVNDGEIEAVYYKSGSSVNGMDISDLEKPLRMDIKNNTMRIEDPEKLTLEFSQFQQAFPINQFTGKGSFSHSNNFYLGTSILYLKVPKDLELNSSSELNVQFIE